MNKTTQMKPADVRPNWFVVDGDNQIVGRLATRLATILMGKHKACYTPHVDCGDYVVVVNIERVRFSGKPVKDAKNPYLTTKTQRKLYKSYSGYPSGQKLVSAEELLERNPERVLRTAVKRMLPRTTLGRQMLDKLKLYAGPAHPHQAQQPAALPAHLQ